MNGQKKKDKLSIDDIDCFKANPTNPTNTATITTTATATNNLSSEQTNLTIPSVSTSLIHQSQLPSININSIINPNIDTYSNHRNDLVQTKDQSTLKYLNKSDILICGVCLRDFSLSNIVEFIDHKLNHGYLFNQRIMNTSDNDCLLMANNNSIVDDDENEDDCCSCKDQHSLTLSSPEPATKLDPKMDNNNLTSCSSISSLSPIMSNKNTSPIGNHDDDPSLINGNDLNRINGISESTVPFDVSIDANKTNANTADASCQLDNKNNSNDNGEQMMNNGDDTNPDHNEKFTKKVDEEMNKKQSSSVVTEPFNYVNDDNDGDVKNNVLQQNVQVKFEEVDGMVMMSEIGQNSQQQQQVKLTERTDDENDAAVVNDDNVDDNTTKDSMTLTDTNTGTVETSTPLATNSTIEINNDNDNAEQHDQILDTSRGHSSPMIVETNNVHSNEMKPNDTLPGKDAATIDTNINDNDNDANIKTFNVQQDQSKMVHPPPPHDHLCRHLRRLCKHYRLRSLLSKTSNAASTAYIGGTSDSTMTNSHSHNHSHNNNNNHNTYYNNNNNNSKFSSSGERARTCTMYLL